nr:MAG TPA: Sporulation protein Cse60 [Caudoviricetes sp.]DAS72483.1 MAG TPA: Sporulation protein Cse60 [Caudoviricetes sp.]
MIRAKLFKNCEYATAAEQLESFVNNSSINEVINIVRTRGRQWEEELDLTQTYVTEILLIYREGNE